MKNSSIDIYVDGSIDRNVASEFSRGGAAAVLVAARDGKVQELLIRTRYYSGYETVTNNRMELRAMEIALQAIEKNAEVRLSSDSKYALNSIFGTNQAKVNQDLINDIKDTIVCKELQVTSFHIHGHKGSFLNEVADYAARETILQERAIDATITPKSAEAACLTCAHFPDCVGVGHRLTLDSFKQVMRALDQLDWKECDLRMAYSPSVRKTRRPQSTPNGSIRSGR
jgi:ribonuclease HI